jgi:hypothetical protein
MHELAGAYSIFAPVVSPSFASVAGASSFGSSVVGAASGVGVGSVAVGSGVSVWPSLVAGIGTSVPPPIPEPCCPPGAELGGTLVPFGPGSAQPPEPRAKPNNPHTAQAVHPVKLRIVISLTDPEEEKPLPECRSFLPPGSHQKRPRPLGHDLVYPLLQKPQRPIATVSRPRSQALLGNARPAGSACSCGL